MVRFRTLFSLILFVGISIGCGSPREVNDPGGNEQSSEADPVVVRYANTAISQSELDSAYAASVGGPANAADTSLSAYREFLDQYLNFRLKVRAARDAQLDTLSGVQRDIQNYRQKIARPKLLRREVYEPLARTLYERRQEEVDVSHILIRPPSEQDTLAARRTLRKIADSLDQGVPFSELAYRNSEDPSAQKKGRRGYEGRLGYIRAGQIVEPFENRMYALDPGQVSDPFRTQYGYHVLKVHDRRPAKPPVQISHILRRPEGDSVAAGQFLDSLRTAILSDSTTFAQAAKSHSQDPRSASKGGDLGEVNPQSLPENFRRAVASLDTTGAVSGIVETRLGLHLIKLTGRNERQSFEKTYDELKEQISERSRVEKRTTALAHEMRAMYDATVDTTRILEAAGIGSVDSLARPILSLLDQPSGSNPSVAALEDSTYALNQVARHLTQMDGGAQTTVGGLVEGFMNEKALQYAAARFAQRDSSLAKQMRKYREGVLLFRFMQDSVWTAAAQDTAGLRTTYRQNKSQYRFPERIRTIVLRAPTDSLLRPHKEAYQGPRSFESTVQAASSDSLVSVDTVFVTDRSAEVYQPVLSLSDGELTGPTSQENESLLMVRDTQLPPRQKTFEEARSSVVQDYQEIYEDRVIQRLRERYNAKTYPQRLRPPFSGSTTAP